MRQPLLIVGQVLPGGAPSAAAGWIAAALITSILSWVAFVLLPGKDKQLREMMDVKDKQLHELIQLLVTERAQHRAEYMLATETMKDGFLQLAAAVREYIKVRNGGKG